MSGVSALEDPAWGPVEPAAAAAAHPLSNGAVAGLASAAGVYLEGGRLDALVLCDGEVAQPAGARFGLAQVRRGLSRGRLRLVHVTFAPAAPRPLLLALVRLENASDELAVVGYTELWDAGPGPYRAVVGACEREGAGVVWALADASTALRASPPREPPETGLALELQLPLPARARRELAFAYVAAASRAEAAALVRAWRGDAAAELRRTAAHWQRRLGTRGAAAVDAYRSACAALSPPGR